MSDETFSDVENNSGFPAGNGPMTFKHELFDDRVRGGTSKTSWRQKTAEELDDRHELQRPPPEIKYPSAGPVALVAYGMTMITACLPHTGWMPVDKMTDISIGCELLGGLTQWLAGLFLVLDNQTLGGVAHLAYGCFWIGAWHNGLLDKLGHIDGASDVAMTVWMIQWGVFTTLLLIGAGKMGWLVKLVFSLLAASYFLFAAGVWSADMDKVSGYVGVLAGISGLYAAFGGIFEKELGISVPM